MSARLISTIAAILASLVAAAGLIARVLPVTNHPTLFVSALSPYLPLGAVVAMGFFLLARRYVLAGGAAALTVTAVAAQQPLFIGSGGPHSGDVPVRILTANVHRRSQRSARNRLSRKRFV